ncbi:MAG: hypothetical protein Q9195_009262 [Heterodermia aff. obscurata]
MAPRLIFGTATFGMDATDFQDADSVQNLLKVLRDIGIDYLDTAARYPPRRPGRSEELIGENRELSSGFKLDTKVYMNTQTNGSGDLRDKAVEESMQSSLQRLKRSQVNVLYAHRADPSTPLEEQITAFNRQIEQGRCAEWAVSNVPPAMLEQMLRICEERGLRKPSCFQGEYNVITRGMETRLMPILSAHGMRYNAFSTRLVSHILVELTRLMRPLAAGFLTGKLINNEHAGTRFADDNPLGKLVQNLFGAEDLHSALKTFQDEARSHNMTPLEVSVRWIAHHSALRNEDGIILGASKVEQIQENVKMIERGPLPGEVLKATERIWAAVNETRADII